MITRSVRAKVPFITTTLLALAIAALASGCAYPVTQPKEMAPSGVVPEHKHSATLSVKAHPSTTKTPFFPDGKWLAFLTADTFAEALRQTLRESGVFRAIDTPDSDYSLNIFLVSSTESGAFNKNAQLVTKWILTRNATGEDVFRENISSQYTAKTGAAFDGSTRLRLAEEGAARENIKPGVLRLSQLSLTP